MCVLQTRPRESSPAGAANTEKNKLYLYMNISNFEVNLHLFKTQEIVHFFLEFLCIYVFPANLLRCTDTTNNDLVLFTLFQYNWEVGGPVGSQNIFPIVFGIFQLKVDI